MSLNNTNNDNNNFTNNDNTNVVNQETHPTQTNDIVVNNNQSKTNNRTNTISGYDQIMLDEGDAVFIGRGTAYGDTTTMHGVFGTKVYFDKQGRMMPTFDPVTKEPIDPQVSKNFGRWQYVELTPGGLCKLPWFNEEKFNLACQSQQFAKAEYVDQVNEWYEEGLTGEEVYENLKQVNAVLMPKGTPLIVHSGYGSCTGCQ